MRCQEDGRRSRLPVLDPASMSDEFGTRSEHPPTNDTAQTGVDFWTARTVGPASLVLSAMVVPTAAGASECLIAARAPAADGSTTSFLGDSCNPQSRVATTVSSSAMAVSSLKPPGAGRTRACSEPTDLLYASPRLRAFAPSPDSDPARYSRACRAPSLAPESVRV